jgi:hypothetical protein
LEPMRKIDHMWIKMWVGGRKRILQGGSYGHPHRAGGQPLVAQLETTNNWRLVAVGG